MATTKSEINDMYKDLDNFKQIPFAENYLISKFGLVYNKKTKNYLTPIYHPNGEFYYVNLKIAKRQNQIKHLLYITYTDPNFNLEILKTKSKYCIHIKNTREDLPFINFTVDDLEFISKSDLLKEQIRFNKIINKYDLEKNFIRSYNNIEKAKIDLEVNDGKYITACASKKQKKYKNFIFRYDEIDEIKYPNLIDEEETKIPVEEFNKYTEEEIWKELNEVTTNNTINPISYYISNFGNFKSKKLITSKRNKKCGEYKINTPNQSITSGYKYCSLSTDNDNPLKLRTNVLVAKYFLTIPNHLSHLPMNKIDVDHIDHNKLNNHYTNLQYLSKRDNVVKG